MPDSVQLWSYQTKMISKERRGIIMIKWMIIGGVAVVMFLGAVCFLGCCLFSSLGEFLD